MTDEEKLQEFTQQVHLSIYNRRIDDITDTDGVEWVEKIKIWCNLFLDELEMEVDSNGKPINWSYLRENDHLIGTIASASDTFDLPSGARRLAVDIDRPLYITQDDTVIALWDVVAPNQLTSRNHYSTRDQRVTYVNEKIVFSRSLNDTEVGGKVYADIINSFPRLADDDTSLFDLPIPRQLLVLGVAKNSSLSDIVQGGLSPSFTQKYDNILEGHKMESDQSGAASEVVTEDNSHITGVY